MEIRKVSIDLIKPAEYNPRKDLQAGDEEYEKLKRSLQEFDLVEPLVWNERTGNYEGGLFDHCYAVAETLKQLTKANRLKWEHPRSPLVVGMFHDLCKIDQYITVVDDPGVEMFGGEVKGRTYTFEYNDDYLIDGHGDKSVMYLAQHMKLTPEEVICIRWHMGAFDEKSNWKYYSKAVNKYPILNRLKALYSVGLSGAVQDGSR